MIESIEILLEINFASIDDSKEMFEVINPEVLDLNFDRSKVTIELEERIILLKISANDLNSALANVNSFLKWINLSNSASLSLKNIRKD